MKTVYDADVDALSVRLTDSAIVDSEEVRPGIVFDFDRDGWIVGFEILNAQEMLSKGLDLRKMAQKA